MFLADIQLILYIFSLIKLLANKIIALINIKIHLNVQQTKQKILV